MSIGITTHILDLGTGQPARGLRVSLSRRTGGTWQVLGEERTDQDGRIGQWRDSAFMEGTYRLHFATGEWFESQGRKVFYPSVEIVFLVDTSKSHYHVPLLLNGWGYSTYRGS